jgi:hypothetical protein
MTRLRWLIIPALALLSWCSLREEAERNSR